jgi:hypothetical protein
VQRARARRHSPPIAFRKSHNHVPQGAGRISIRKRKEALSFLARIVAVVTVFTAPFVVFSIVRRIVSGEAADGYFEQVSQIFPILLLALVIEQRYLSRRWLPDGPSWLASEGAKLVRWVTIFARVYAFALLMVLAWGEITALHAVAHEGGTDKDLEVTAGALAAGFTALVTTAVLGAGRPVEPTAGKAAGPVRRQGFRRGHRRRRL